MNHGLVAKLKHHESSEMRTPRAAGSGLADRPTPGQMRAWVDIRGYMGPGKDILRLTLHIAHACVYMCTYESLTGHI